MRRKDNRLVVLLPNYLIDLNKLFYELNIGQILVITVQNHFFFFFFLTSTKNGLLGSIFGGDEKLYSL